MNNSDNNTAKNERFYFNQPVLDDFFCTANGPSTTKFNFCKIYELFTDFLLKIQADSVVKDKMRSDAEIRSKNIRQLATYFGKYNGMGIHAGHNSLTERDAKGRKIYEKHTTVKVRLKDLIKSAAPSEKYQEIRIWEN